MMMISPTELQDAIAGPCTVFYHAGCMDGFAAALAAWKRLGTQNVTYLPFRPHQRVEEREVFRRHVLFLDVAPDHSQLPEIERMQILSLRILDHHDTSARDWESTPFMIFSSSKSGAWISWDYFHPETRVPRLITYVSDRDNWTRNLPRVDDLMAALWMTPFRTRRNAPNFEEWDEILSKIEGDQGFLEYCDRGVPVRQVMERHISIAVSKAFETVFKGHRIWSLNDPTPHRSMVADVLLRKPLADGRLPDAVMIWYFHHPSQGFACSLRSRSDGDVDVSILAESCGGGGRRNTAAFVKGLDKDVFA